MSDSTVVAEEHLDVVQLVGVHHYAIALAERRGNHTEVFGGKVIEIRGFRPPTVKYLVIPTHFQRHLPVQPHDDDIVRMTDKMVSAALRRRNFAFINGYPEAGLHILLDAKFSRGVRRRNERNKKLGCIQWHWRSEILIEARRAPATVHEGIDCRRELGNVLHVGRPPATGLLQIVEGSLEARALVVQSKECYPRAAATAAAARAPSEAESRAGAAHSGHLIRGDVIGGRHGGHFGKGDFGETGGRDAPGLRGGAHGLLPAGHVDLMFQGARTGIGIGRAALKGELAFCLDAFNDQIGCGDAEEEVNRNA